MAAVSTPNLVVTKEHDNREIKATYVIDFDFFDNATNLRYKHVVELIGDDTNVAGDPATSAPDDVLATLRSEVVRAGEAPELNGNGLPRLPVDLKQVFGEEHAQRGHRQPEPGRDPDQGHPHAASAGADRAREQPLPRVDHLVVDHTPIAAAATIDTRD